MNSISENKSADEMAIDDIDLQKLYKLLAMKEDEYRIRSNFKSQYRFVLSIEDLEKREKLSHL